MTDSHESNDAYLHPQLRLPPDLRKPEAILSSVSKTTIRGRLRKSELSRQEITRLLQKADYHLLRFSYAADDYPTQQELNARIDRLVRDYRAVAYSFRLLDRRIATRFVQELYDPPPTDALEDYRSHLKRVARALNYAASRTLRTGAKSRQKLTGWLIRNLAQEWPGGVEWGNGDLPRNKESKQIEDDRITRTMCGRAYVLSVLELAPTDAKDEELRDHHSAITTIKPLSPRTLTRIKGQRDFSFRELALRGNRSGGYKASETITTKHLDDLYAEMKKMLDAIPRQKRKSLAKNAK